MKRVDERLPLRAHEVLTSVVRAYIETGEPVASRTVSRARLDNLSPATIRNAMADLEDSGYLSQPHTSAGRVPTEKAFRYFVASLEAGRIPPGEAERMRRQLASSETLEEHVEKSSHVLTEITRNVGIAAAIPTSAQVLDQVELVSLSGGRVLMILATRDRMVRHRVVTLDEPVSPEELASIRNYVNRQFSGWTLFQARTELLRRIDVERAACDALQRKLTLLYSKGLLDAGEIPEVYLDGASNLIGESGLNQQKLRELMRALEEKKRLVELLDRFLEEMPGEVRVQIGLGEAHPAMNELVLIGTSVALPGGLMAKVAVLGPMRIHYERVMGAVLHLGRLFTETYH